MKILVGILIIFGIIIISYYNRFIRLRERVRNSLSQIDVELQKRMDLIPNLVEVVKGYAKYEKETLEEVIKIRNKYMSSNNINERIENAKDIGAFFNRLIMLCENYPELKANKNFLELQNQLDKIEKRIGFSRQFYNDTVTKYNENIKMFPGNIIANLFNFSEEKFFKADEKVNNNISIDFYGGK